MDERRARPDWRNSQRQTKTVEVVWTNGVTGYTGETQNSKSSVDERRARPYWRNSQGQVKTVEAVWTNGVPGHTGETYKDRSKL